MTADRSGIEMREDAAVEATEEAAVRVLLMSIRPSDAKGNCGTGHPSDAGRPIGLGRLYVYRDGTGSF